MVSMVMPNSSVAQPSDLRASYTPGVLATRCSSHGELAMPARSESVVITKASGPMLPKGIGIALGNRPEPFARNVEREREAEE